MLDKKFFKCGIFSSCGYEIGRAADPGQDIKRKLKKRYIIIYIFFYNFLIINECYRVQNSFLLYVNVVSISAKNDRFSVLKWT